MKISKDEAVYAVLKMVLNEQVSLRMVTMIYGYITC